jgi:CRISP-associated protein Cas1
MKPLYIVEPGFVGRDQNSILFENEIVKRRYPIKGINSIFFLCEVTINSKSLGLFAKDEIPLHFFGYFGAYKGTFWPEKNRDGKLLLAQCESFKKRLKFAKEMVKGSIHNMRKVLLKYKIRDYPEKLEEYKLNFPDENINSILSHEATAKKIYYKAIKFIVKDKDFKFIKRSYHPPEDRINALMSFLNALLYGTVLAEIYKTRLDPLISYLHEPSQRFSLQYDIADIFKPIICDRLLFTLINKKIVRVDDFEGLRLKKDSIKKVVKAYEDKLDETVRFNDYEVFSYRFIIRKECFKIINDIEKGEEYQSFKMWW